MKNRYDKPARNRCDCGSKVKNHHWLCDKCWGKKHKKTFEKNRKITGRNTIINPITEEMIKNYPSLNKKIRSKKLK